jgi:hypothetical protein
MNHEPQTVDKRNFCRGVDFATCIAAPFPRLDRKRERDSVQDIFVVEATYTWYSGFQTCLRINVTMPDHAYCRTALTLRNRACLSSIHFGFYLNVTKLSPWTFYMKPGRSSC